MTRSVRTVLAALTLVVAMPGAAAAELDALSFALHRDQQPQVRWDNLAGAPFVQAPTAPAHDPDSGNHVIRLEAGATATLYLPGGADLLLADRGDGPGVAAATVRTSIDGTAWLTAEADRRTARGHAFMAPEDTPYLVEIQAPVTTAVRFAAFRSRRVAVPEQPLYRTDVTPSAQRTLQIAERTRDVRQLEPGGRIRLTVRGPTRLAFPHRRLGAGPRLNLDAAYSLSVRVDGERVRHVRGRTRPQRAAVARLDGTPVAVSTRETAFVTIPDGEHTLTLRTSAPVLLRVLRLSSPATLLARVANWRDDPADIVTELASTEANASAGAPRVPALQRALRAHLRTPGDARSGPAAAAKLAQRATGSPFPARVRRAAADIRGGHTFWRDLLPTDRVTGARTAYVRPNRLRDPLADRDPAPVMLDAEAEALAGSLRQQRLVRLGGDGPQHLRFPLPQRDAPTQVRLYLAGGGRTVPATVDLEIGETQTHRVQIRRHGRPPDVAPAAAPAMAALRVLDSPQAEPPRAPRTRSQSGRQGLRGTLTGRFSALGESAPLVNAGVVTVDLPKDANEITVRAIDGPSVRVGLAYRVGKPFELDESGYRQAVRTTGGADAARARFRDQLKARIAGDRIAGDAEPPAAALAAHWVPLVDLLAARRALYAGDLADRGHRFDAPDTAADAGRVDALIRTAKRHTAAGNWGAAAQNWGDLARAATGATWRRAELQRVNALRRIGSDGLADRLLRGFHLYSDDPRMRDRAFAKLRARLQREDAIARLIGAHVVQLQRTDRLPALAPVVGLLLASGEDARARDLAALLPPADVPTRARVQALRAGGWARGYRRALSRLPEPRQARWRAMDALAEGDAAAARRALAGTDANARWRAAVADGTAIREALGRDPSPATRGRWSEWQQTHPGPSRFENAMRLVTEAAAQPTLRSLRRAKPVTTALATPEHPVRLAATAGRLRVTFRLRMAPDGRDQHGWGRIRVNERVRHVPVAATAPTEGLVPIDGAYAVGPGRTTTVDLSGTAGRVDIEVDRPMLIQVEQAGPVQRLPVLPAPWPSVRDAVGRGPTPREACDEVVSVVAARTDRRRPVCGRQAGLVAALDGRDARKDLRLEPGAQPGARLARELAACDPPYSACTQIGQAIYASDLTDTGSPLVDRLRARVAPYFGWERVEQVRTSAGLRTVDVAGWQPHSPVLRARAPFLGDLPANTQVLTGGRSLHFDFVNQAPTTLVLDLRTVDMPTYPAEPAHVRYRLAGQPWREATVPDSGRRIAVPVPPGRQAVEVAIANPLQERYVVVTPRERRNGRTRPLEAPQTRSYQVATDAEPAIFAVGGPALVRIDRFDDGEITSEYRRVPAGRSSVPVGPAAGRNEDLVRLYALRHRARARSNAPRVTVARPGRPAQRRLTADDTGAEPAPLGDRSLAGQVDGTTSLGLGYRLRRQVEDEVGGARDGDGFVELRAAHRRYDPVADRYDEATLLARARDDGRPTFGAAADVHWPDRVVASADRLPLDLSLSLSGFAQDTAGRGLEAAVTGRAAARHRRRVGPRTSISGRVDAFARALTLDSGLAGAETADADVFTRYKRDHPIGWGVRAGVTHRPFLDAAVYGRLGARSNADLWPGNLDHIYALAGVRQFLAGVRLDVAYRETRYFADDDRQNAVSTREIGLDVGYDLWRPAGDRLELVGRLSHDLRRRETNFGVFLTWHIGTGQTTGSNGRGTGRRFRDFPPATELFRSLREARAPGWEPDE